MNIPAAHRPCALKNGLLSLAVIGLAPFPSAHAAEFCDEVKSLVADGHNGFAAVRAGNLKVTTASECEVLEAESYSLGELRCEWRYSQFTETAKLDESTKTLVTGLYKCLKPSFSSSDMPDEYRFRGKSHATKQLVDVLASSDTTQKHVTLYLVILKPEK